MQSVTQSTYDTKLSEFGLACSVLDSLPNLEARRDIKGILTGMQKCIADEVVQCVSAHALDTIFYCRALCDVEENGVDC